MTILSYLRTKRSRYMYALAVARGNRAASHYWMAKLEAESGWDEWPKTDSGDAKLSAYRAHHPKKNEE